MSGGNPDYLALLEGMREMHLRKAADYGTDDDPMNNLRASVAFGIPAWVGAALRANDKMKRVQAFATKGVLANESIDDSLMDLAAYALLALVLLREEREGVKRMAAAEARLAESEARLAEVEARLAGARENPLVGRARKDAGEWPTAADLLKAFGCKHDNLPQDEVSK